MKYLFLLSLLLFVVSSCTPPVVLVPADLQTIANSELGFLHSGETTREEVLLKMGNPAARFEADRILIYQVLPTSDGVIILAPQINQLSGLRAWKAGTYSLVLVFDQEGTLTKMDLAGFE